MEIIFENKVVERNDIGNRMRFPTGSHDVHVEHLPSACRDEGRFENLLVEDENGTPWTITCRKQNEMIYFTKGWKAFREGRGIGVGHKINFYKLDRDSSGTGAQYKIEVMAN